MPESPTQPTRREKRQYSPEVIANALAVVKANNNNLSKSARELNIPRLTLREWVLNGRRNTAEVSVIQRVKEGELGEKLRFNAHRIVDSMSDLTDDELRKVPLGTRAVALGILIDKTQALAGLDPGGRAYPYENEEERRLAIAGVMKR